MMNVVQKTSGLIMAAAVSFLMVFFTNGCGVRRGAARCENDAMQKKRATSRTDKAETSRDSQKNEVPRKNTTAGAPPDRWFQTPETLAKHVLEGLRKKDFKGLDQLRVSKKTYTEILWPRFKSARHPDNTIPAKFHWFMLNSNCLDALGDIIDDYGGKELILISLDHEKIVDYGTYKLWRRVFLKVRRKDSDTVEKVRLFGAIVELDGRFKLLAYVS
jgi:hypothetical protein